MKPKHTTKTATLSISNDLIDAVFSVEAESHNCEAQANNVAAICTNRGWTVERDNIGNVIVSHGKADVRPVLVAHLDTVHDITGSMTLQRIGRKLYAMDTKTCRQIGVGGDDKCGIVAAIAVADKLPAFRLLFVVDEEVGCIGSSAIDMDFTKDASLLLQADRRGSTDAVHRIGGLDLQTNAFRQAVKPLLKAHGYAPTTGAMTDVEELTRRNAGVCAMNLSAGYYNPHTDHEFVDLDVLDNCAALMLAICQQLGTKKWKLPPRATFSTFSQSKPSRPAGVSRLAWDWKQEDARNQWDATSCPACGSLCPWEDMQGGICSDCASFWSKR